MIYFLRLLPFAILTVFFTVGRYLGSTSKSRKDTNGGITLEDGELPATSSFSSKPPSKKARVVSSTTLKTDLH